MAVILEWVKPRELFNRVLIEMKANKKYFPVLRCIYIMLYKVVLRFESVDEILMFARSTESYLALCTIYYLAQDVWSKS